MHSHTLTRPRGAAGLLILFALVFLIPALAFAHPGGAPDGHAGLPPGAVTCHACHDSFEPNQGGGGAGFAQLPVQYTPSTAYNILILVGHTGAQQWGFQVVAVDENGQQAGYLIATSDSTWVSQHPPPELDYLNQSASGTLPGADFGLWQATWIAPPVGTGTISFHIAGLAADGDGTLAGDHVYTTTRPMDESDEGGEEGPYPFFTVEEHDFGLTALPQSRSWETALYNVGNETLVVNEYLFSEGEVFSVQPAPPITVQPGGTAQLTVVFTPEMQFTYRDTLIVQHQGGAGPTARLALRGEGTAPLPPEPFDLVSPPDGAAMGMPPFSLRWRATVNLDSSFTGATYRLEVDRESDFATADGYETGTDTFYTFSLGELEQDELYFWRVLALDTNTEGTYSDSFRAFFTRTSGVENQSQALPETLRLRAHPQPFNSSVRITVEGSGPNPTGRATTQNRLTCRIYDLLGREVATLKAGSTGRTAQFTWRPQTQAAGLYFAQVLRGGETVGTLKLLHLP